MSAEDLSKLSIADTMVTTRAAAAAEARARQTPSLNTAYSSRSNSTTASPTPSLIEASDGHKFNVSTFSEDLRRRAKRGLMGDNDITMKFCKEIGNGAKQYLFHLDDDITVRMTGKRAPQCSCGANEGGKACKHIFWMLGQLTTPVPDKAGAFELAEDGSSVRETHPADIITKFSLENIAAGLDWTYQDDPLPEEEEMLDEIANMLSVFEPTEALPAEFKGKETPDLPIRARKYREFQGLVSEYAMRNPALFIQLQEMIPPAFQVQVFFDKINHRIDQTFIALDEYLASGPTNTLSEALDVKKCAARLKALVGAVDHYYDEQIDYGMDDDNDIAVQAAAALVKILYAVTGRNVDAYANIAWGGMPPTDPRENNLFVCLVSTGAETEGLFVLETLLKLPQEHVLGDHYEHLLEVGERLKTTPWTPPAYLEAFRTLMPDVR